MVKFSVGESPKLDPMAGQRKRMPCFGSSFRRPSCHSATCLRKLHPQRDGQFRADSWEACSFSCQGDMTNSSPIQSLNFSIHVSLSIRYQQAQPFVWSIQIAKFHRNEAASNQHDESMALETHLAGQNSGGCTIGRPDTDCCEW